MIERQLLDSIKDPQTRDVLQRLFEDLKEVQLLQGDFQFIELEVKGAVTNLKHPHNLGFHPKDVIQTSLTGAGSLTWNYSKFDATNLDITTTDACKVRAFVGRFREQGA